MTITDYAALIGIISGISGLTLGIIIFLRDKGKVSVTLKWDMKPYGDTKYDKNKLYGVVTVTNIGRRPVFFSHVALKLPRRHKEKQYIILFEGITGKKLSEGDQPAQYMIDQDGLDRFSKDWNRIRAEVSMSTGKKYFSKRVREIPSWVK